MHDSLNRTAAAFLKFVADCGASVVTRTCVKNTYLENSRSSDMFLAGTSLVSNCCGGYRPLQASAFYVLSRVLPERRNIYGVEVCAQLCGEYRA